MNERRTVTILHQSWKKQVRVIVAIASIAGITIAIYAIADINHLIPHVPGGETPMGAWWYGFENQSVDDVLAKASKYGLDFLYVSLDTYKINASSPSYDPQYSNKVADLIQRGHDAGIEMHWMTLEWSGFVHAAAHDDALGFIQRACNFARDRNLPLAGIHVDAEPHAEPSWAAGSWETRDGIFQDYLLLLSKVRATIDEYSASGLDLELSAAIGHWYHDATLRGDLSNGTADRLHQDVHVLVPMIYDGCGQDARGLIHDSELEMAEAHVAVGIGMHEYPTAQALLDVANTVAAHYEHDPNFKGICIFHGTQLP